MSDQRHELNASVAQLEAEVALVREALTDLLAQVRRLSLVVPNKGITRLGLAQAFEREIDRITQKLDGAQTDEEFGGPMR